MRKEKNLQNGITKRTYSGQTSFKNKQNGVGKNGMWKRNAFSPYGHIPAKQKAKPIKILFNHLQLRVFFSNQTVEGVKCSISGHLLVYHSYYFPPSIFTRQKELSKKQFLFFYHILEVSKHDILCIHQGYVALLNFSMTWFIATQSHSEAISNVK